MAWGLAVNHFLTACMAFATGVLVRDIAQDWRDPPKPSPQKRLAMPAAERPQPQCRLVKNGRPYAGWIFSVNDAGRISGACLYDKRGRPL